MKDREFNSALNKLCFVLIWVFWATLWIF